MPAERYFVPSDFLPNSTLFIEGQEFHHLIHVMRAKQHDPIELVNGRGDLARATVQQLEKKKAVCFLEEVHHVPKPQFEVVLAQAIPKMNRLDFILEKGTELGMTQLWLFPSQRGERKVLTEHQLERMQGLTIAAMKQCGSLHLPIIQCKPSLDHWQQEWMIYPSFFGDVDPKAPSCTQKFQENPLATGLIFFIGPESGLTEDEEISLLKLHAQGVKLHRNILRTDTAALAALCTIAQYLSE
ncbi:MAG: hypothetical protein CK425_04865 [Parachlamydia sp.]|nr:MAG: hypothetical protein CK425_04865 [Parachlamydia sp.]